MTATATISAPPPPASAAAQAQTRERLLEAAGLVFAEHGFRKATVREICRRAGANVAAVHYHFDDKMGLYAAVLNHWLGIALEKFPPDMGLAPDAAPEQKLHAYIKSYLFRLCGQGAPAWHGRLMAQEMIDPTGAIDQVLDTTIRPLAARLSGIVKELLGDHATEESVRLCTSSVAGQICFYRHAEQMLVRLYPGHKLDGPAIERLADHITRFSLEGIRSYVDQLASA